MFEYIFNDILYQCYASSSSPELKIRQSIPYAPAGFSQYPMHILKRGKLEEDSDKHKTESSLNFRNPSASISLPPDNAKERR